jgi:hypothetical protein
VPHLGLVDHVALAAQAVSQLLEADGAALVLVIRGKQLLQAAGQTIPFTMSACMSACMQRPLHS